jgi:hypothetical protein
MIKFKMKKPKYIYRKDDGFRFTRQKNGKYTMDKSLMNPKYEYEYFVLSGSNFVTNKKDIFDFEIYIKSVEPRNDGHGNGDFDE